MTRIQAQQVLAAVIALAIAMPAGALPPNSSASAGSKTSKGVASKPIPEVVGIIAAGQGAAVRDVVAPAGTTIYSGDTLKTYGGGAVLAIGDSQVRLAAESRARLLRAQGRVQVEIQRGRMSLRSSSRSPVEARLADATITAADAAVAGIAMLSENKAMVAAERGSVTLRTARDNKSVMLRAGESLEITLVPAPQGSSNATNARLLSPAKVAIFGAVLLGGISLIAWSIQHDNDLPAGPKQDLISPFRLR